MPYIVLENFKFGLDTRKSELTSNPGTLVKAENGHITQGAEFEVRKAFVLLGTLPRNVALSGGPINGDSNADTLNSYGLQPTSSGLLTFGSADASRNTVAAGIPYVFPTGVTYQKLRHWTDVIVGAVNRPAMTGVTFSCAFNGKAFVISTFGTGALGVPASTQLHYDGSAIDQYNVGTVWMSGGNNGSLLMYGLYTQINAGAVSGYTAAFVGDALNSVDISGPTTDTVSLTPSDTDGVANLTTYNAIPSSSAVTAVAAKGTFNLVAWVTGTKTITITDAVGATVLPALAASAATPASLVGMAITIVKGINNGGSGYSASWAAVIVAAAVQYQITVVAPASYGATTQTLTLAFSAGSGTITTSPGAASNAFSGGVTGVTGNATPARASFDSATWTVGSTWTLVMTVNGLSYTFGAGNINGIAANFCFSFGNRVYMIAGGAYYFSKIGNAKMWETQDTGAGFVTVSDRSGDPQNLVSVVTYQGKIAVFSRYVVEIWNAPADPTLFSLLQTLQNTGAVSKRSVQPMGDLDVLYLSDTGVRSLRVRDSSLNAFVSDIGSPIDQLIVDAMIVAGSTLTQNSCGVVEPQANRYWLHLNGTIYVLSYFPTSKIVAWSTYLPTYGVLGTAVTIPANYTASQISYSGLTIGQCYKWVKGAHEVSFTCGKDVLTATGYFLARATTAIQVGTGATVSTTSVLSPETQTTFVPESMVVFAGQVYILATDGKVFVYGGTDNQTFDGNVATLELPWLDEKKSGHKKKGMGIEAAASGCWDYSTGMDMIGGTLNPVGSIGNSQSPTTKYDSTFPLERLEFQGDGTHVKIKATSRPGSTSVRRVISRLLFHYNLASETQ